MLKKTIVVLMAVVSCLLSGCATAGLPKPPVHMPFAVQNRGTIIETELQIMKDRSYRFAILFYYYGKAPNADSERVRKLAGYHAKDWNNQYTVPGVAVPIEFKIEGINNYGEKVLIEKEVLVVGYNTHGFRGFSNSIGGSFGRKIEHIRLKPGIYRITVKNMKDIPELSGTPVTFSVYSFVP